MDKAMIEEYAFIAAGSLVTPGKIVKSRELWAGSPAKFIRKIMEEEVRFMQDNIENYIDLAKEYK
jgi:carbonic anhydrase/acetyltransferase-like protein (isoleucine patch superfamily)